MTTPPSTLPPHDTLAATMPDLEALQAMVDVISRAGRMPTPAELLNAVTSLTRVMNELSPSNSAVQARGVSVYGRQSTGKSSVLNALLGFELLPTSLGTCTRAPLNVMSLVPLDPRLRGMVKVAERPYAPKHNIVYELAAAQPQTGFDERAVSVTAQCADVVSLFVQDNPGIENQEGPNRDVQLRISRASFAERVAAPNSRGMALLVDVLGSDRSNLTCQSVSHHLSQPQRPSDFPAHLSDGRLVMVLTNADTVIKTFRKANKFDQCTSWKDVYQVLFGPILENWWARDVRIFSVAVGINAGTDRSASTWFNDAMEQGQIKVMKNLDAISVKINSKSPGQFRDDPVDRAALDRVFSLAELRGFVYSKQLELFFGDTMEIEATLDAEGLRCAEAFDEVVQRLDRSTAQLPFGMIKTLFSVFSTVFRYFVDGDRNELGFSQPSTAMVSKVKEVNAPNKPHTWFEFKPVDAVLRASARSIAEEIDDARAFPRLPETHGPGFHPFPFVDFPDSDATAADVEAENAKRELEFGAHYGSDYFGTSDVTLIQRMQRLRAELNMKAMLVHPPRPTRDDFLVRAQHAGAFGSDLKQRISNVVNDLFQLMCGERFAGYVAHRVSALVGECAHRALAFLEQHTDLRTLLAIPLLKRDVTDLIERYIALQVHNGLYDEVLRAAAVQVTDIDVWLPLHLELMPFFMHRDLKAEQAWFETHDRELYTLACRLGRFEFARSRGQADFGELGPVAALRSRLGAFSTSIPALQKALMPMMAYAHAMQQDAVQKHVSDSDGTIFSDELVRDDQFNFALPDLMHALSRMLNTPEVGPGLRQNFANLTDDDLHLCQAAVGRQFRARVVEFSKSLSTILTRQTSAMLGKTFQLRNSDDLMAALIDMLNHYKQYGRTTTATARMRLNEKLFRPERTVVHQTPELNDLISSSYSLFADNSDDLQARDFFERRGNVLQQTLRALRAMRTWYAADRAGYAAAVLKLCEATAV